MTSRFVSSKDIEKAREERAAEWKAAYERLGQAPPPLPEEQQPYDSRPLAEQLAAVRDKKEEEFQEKVALKNQWRGLNDEETRFLAEKADEKREQERRDQLKVDEELAKFRQAVSSRPPPSSSVPAALAAAPIASTSATASLTATAPSPLPRPKPKTPRNLLAGVARKKQAPAAAPASTTAVASPPAATVSPSTAKRKADGGPDPLDKRPKPNGDP